MLRRIPPVILIVLLLAVFGFLQTLIHDPVNTLIVLGLSVAVFLAIRNYLRYGNIFAGATSVRKPKQAKPKPPMMGPAMKKKSPPPRKNHPFRVIEGKKAKGKGSQNDQDSQNNISH